MPHRDCRQDIRFYVVCFIAIPLRRTLGITVKIHFSNLDELRDYIQSIEVQNHRTTKNWTAAQNFYRLAGAFEGAMNELPRGYPFLVRLIVRPFRWIITRYRFPPWMPIPDSIKHALNPPETVDFAEQKNRLLQVIELFKQFPNKHLSHPVLGKLGPDEWIGFHLRHCEHHLSFIELNRQGE